MELRELVQAERCRILHSRTKTEVLMDLMDMAADTGLITDIEGLRKEIFYREQIMSTGIGQGIAIPHVRFKGVKSPLVLVGIRSQGIDDYVSLDNETVKFVFMILVGENQHKEYLRILSLLVYRLKNEDYRSRLAGAESDDDVFEILTGD